MKTYKTIVIALCALFVFGCGAARQTASPTDTLKNFVAASQKKDVEAIKNALSKNSLKLLEENAKSQNTTLDELLKKGGTSPVKELPETRNEKIEGDAASVEVKNLVTGDFDTIPFVKEDGSWKIALDKFIEDVKKKMADPMNSGTGAEPNTSDSDSDTQPKTAPNKSAADK